MARPRRARELAVSHLPDWTAHRRTRWVAFGVAVLAGLPGAVAGATAVAADTQPTSGTVHVVAADDTYVLQDVAGHNAGSAASLIASNRPGHEARIYLKFRDADIPAGATITRAELVVHGWHSLPSRLQVNSVRVTSWSEQALTNRNAPHRSAPVVRAQVHPNSRTAAIDVTELVRANAPVSMSLSPTSRTATVDLVSQEAGAAGPQLRISWRRTHLRRVPVFAPPSDGPTAAGAPVVGPVPTPTDPTTDSPSPSPSPSDPPTTSPSPSPTPSPTSSPTAGCTVSALLVPSCGVWWGGMANPSPGQSQAQALADLEAEQGRPFDIDHYYYKDDQHFPSAAMISQAHEPGKHRLLLLSWKPATDHTWAQVAAGAVDARIDSEADYLKSHFTDKFYLVIWHEPENDVQPTAGSGYTAADYAAMFRHTVLRLRGDGVTNAVTVICYEATPQWGSQSWWPQLWPGADVVDWMGEDAYSIGTSSTWGGTFGPTINRTDHYSYPNWPGFYTWAQQIAPTKPIMIPEYGANEIPGDPSHKVKFFSTMPTDLSHYPAVKAVVYWNNPASTSGEMVESSQSSIDAFRALAQQPIVNPQTVYGERIA